MGSRRLLMCLVLANLASATLLLAPSTVLAQCCAPGPCIPPMDSHYAGSFHSWGGGFAVLLLPVHDLFSECDPPPKGPVGSTTEHTFGSMVHWTNLFVGGVPMGPGSAPATTTVKVTLAHHGRITVYDTEMLQLDISGGSLPPGTMIRQSTLPGQSTLGMTTEEHIPGGNFLISSFFDVFTELSPNFGQTWIPCDCQGPQGHGPVHMALGDCTCAP